MELSTPEPSVSLHLVPHTRAALGITAVTFHHGIKGFPVSCKAGAGGGGGKYFFHLSFLPSIPSLLHGNTGLHALQRLKEHQLIYERKQREVEIAATLEKMSFFHSHQPTAGPLDGPFFS